MIDHVRPPLIAIGEECKLISTFCQSQSAERRPTRRTLDKALITTDNWQMDGKLSVVPRILYDECFGLNLKRAARVVGRRYDEALKPVDLTNGQFATLAVIAEFEPVSMQTLAEHLSMDRTTLTAALKPLERRALVSVRPDDLDRRGRNVNLTDKGVQLLRDAIPLWKKVQRRIIREMGTSGLAVFRAQLAQLSRAVGAEVPAE